jgi:hypothetical protein
MTRAHLTEAWDAGHFPAGDSSLVLDSPMADRPDRVKNDQEKGDFS